MMIFILLFWLLQKMKTTVKVENNFILNEIKDF